ncbi:hypothetical protein CMV_026703, partial [Castanea mollissima]
NQRTPKPQCARKAVEIRQCWSLEKKYIFLPPLQLLLRLHGHTQLCLLDDAVATSNTTTAYCKILAFGVKRLQKIHPSKYFHGK